MKRNIVIALDSTIILISTGFAPCQTYVFRLKKPASNLKKAVFSPSPSNQRLFSGSNPIKLTYAQTLILPIIAAIITGLHCFYRQCPAFSVCHQHLSPPGEGPMATI
jgi:hypothetical protein